MMAWVKTNALTDQNNVLFSLVDRADAANQFFELSVQGTFNDYFEYFIQETQAGNRQTGSFGTEVEGEWTMVAFTWNGPTDTVVAYKDGAEATIAPGLTDSIDLTSTSHFIAVGAHGDATSSIVHDGLIYQAAAWDRVLSENEINAIYNGGNPVPVNLNASFGDYTSAANLRLWYRTGATLSPDLGKNHGLAGSAADLDDEQGTIDSDITNDFPQP